MGIFISCTDQDDEVKAPGPGTDSSQHTQTLRFVIQLAQFNVFNLKNPIYCLILISEEF